MFIGATVSRGVLYMSMPNIQASKGFKWSCG
jgi:hypothetical protein